MTGRLRLGWRKILLGLGCAGVVAGGVCVARVLVARPAPPPAAVAPPPAAPTSSAGPDYTSSYVAVFGDNQRSITREELGEYLIARHGDKLDHLINKRVIEDACKARGIEVTASEVEQKLAEDLKDLNIDRARFVKEFLKARHKTLLEWKEDNIRPELLLMKFFNGRLTVGDEEVRNEYEARFGEKIDCRVIEWSADPGEDAAGFEARVKEMYARVSADEAAFADEARRQKNTSLAAGGGRISRFGRHTLPDVKLEEAAFALRPGEVSPLVPIPAGYVVIKCDSRIPADTSVPFEKVSAELTKEVRERKAQKEFPKVIAELQAAAKAENLIRAAANDDEPYGYSRTAAPGEAKDRPVAYLYDKQATLTRQEFGEYLIQRYGAAQLELLVNKHIIEYACQAANVIVTDAEVDAVFMADCEKHLQTRGSSCRSAVWEAATAMFNRETPRETFVREVLTPNRVNVYSYKEDVIRPKLQLTRLVRDSVKVTDDDLRAAFDAHYGPTVECRMIMWPNSEESQKSVLQEYARIRTDPQAFDEKAATQASPTLAKSGGRLDHPIGHHTTGNAELERIAFSLHEDQVSELIGAPEGFVVLKCVRQNPATKELSQLPEVRDELAQEIIQKKTDVEMVLYFRELQKRMEVRTLLHDPNKPEDLAGAVKRELGGTQPPK
jgi:hypothetical protein